MGLNHRTAARTFRAAFPLVAMVIARPVLCQSTSDAEQQQDIVPALIAVISIVVLVAIACAIVVAICCRREHLIRLRLASDRPSIDDEEEQQAMAAQEADSPTVMPHDAEARTQVVVAPTAARRSASGQFEQRQSPTVVMLEEPHLLGSSMKEMTEMKISSTSMVPPTGLDSDDDDNENEDNEWSKAASPPPQQPAAAGLGLTVDERSPRPSAWRGSGSVMTTASDKADSPVYGYGSPLCQGSSSMVPHRRFDNETAAHSAVFGGMKDFNTLTPSTDDGLAVARKTKTRPLLSSSLPAASALTPMDGELSTPPQTDGFSSADMTPPPSQFYPAFQPPGAGTFKIDDLEEEKEEEEE